jgi:sugar/nucleoside kinase (ribokinase family)
MPLERAREAFMPFVDAADIIIPTAEELKLLTDNPTVKQGVVTLLDDKPDRIIVVTEGKGGCTLYTQEGERHIPGLPVDEVDPTGAGDCFDAGFLVRWLSGYSSAEAARFANTCGALAVAAKGPMAGAQRLADVEAFMRSAT